MPSLSLCLTCVGKERAVISMDAHDSLDELHAMARSTFDSKEIKLQHGFPPSLLEKDASTTLEKAGIQDKDRIVVTISDNNEKTTNAAQKKQKRTQRAAAKAATDSFSDVIRAQDELMKQQQHSNNKKKKSSTSKRKRSAPKAPNLSQLPGGRRLQDGATIPSNKRTKSSTGPKFTNEQDVSMALMDALNGSGDKVGHVLRGAMRTAIANRYEASRAVSKVTAVQSHQYTIQQENGKLVVNYSKGVEGRGMWQETVDAIPREALEAVIAAIYQNEAERAMLQPTTLAQVSPRVFWSLVYLFQHQSDVTTMEECLSTLLPHLDWSFQNKRKRALSSKAKENLRQEEQPQSEENEEAAQQAVHAVESAMEQLGDYDASQRRERAARAALSRHVETNENGTAISTTTEEWKLVTPTERDDDELQECIATTCICEQQQEQILAALHALGIFNWRQLANANADTICQATNIPVDQVEQWMDHAQAQSLDEMMVEICNDNVAAVQVLRDEARTGTVKDLSQWKQMPDLLYASAPSLSEMNIQVEDVRTWCQRAHAVSEELEWVQWYATPVE